MSMPHCKHGSRREEHLPFIDALWYFPGPVSIRRCQKCKLRTSCERFWLKRQKILQSKNQTFSREHLYTQIRAVVFFMLPLLSCYVDEWLGFYYDSHTTLCHVPLSYSEWNGEDDQDPASDNYWSSTDHLQWIKIRLTRFTRADFTWVSNAFAWALHKHAL